MLAFSENWSCNILCEMWKKCDFSFSLQTLLDSRPVFIGLFIKMNIISPFYLYPIFKKIHDIKFPRGRYLLIVLYCTVLYCTVLYCTVQYWSNNFSDLKYLYLRRERWSMKEIPDLRWPAGWGRPGGSQGNMNRGGRYQLSNQRNNLTCRLEQKHNNCLDFGTFQTFELGKMCSTIFVWQRCLTKMLKLKQFPFFRQLKTGTDHS